MQNINEILTGLGIEVPEDKTEELGRLVAANYKTVAEFDKRIGKIEAERDGLRGQLDTANETLKGFEGVDLATIQRELADWKTKAETAERDAAEKLAARDFDDALRARLDELKFTSAAAKAAVTQEIRSKGLKLDNGVILGFDDAIKAIRERDAEAFLDESNPPARFTEPMGRQKSPSAFSQMSLAEKMAYANTHAESAEVKAWLES